MKRHTIFIGTLNIVKMTILPLPTQSKDSMDCLFKFLQPFLQKWKSQSSNSHGIVRGNLGLTYPEQYEKEQSWRTHASQFQKLYKATVNETVWFWGYR